MIKGVLVVNNHGKPRLVKFFESVVRCSRQAGSRVLIANLLSADRRPGAEDRARGLPAHLEALRPPVQLPRGRHRAWCVGVALDDDSSWRVGKEAKIIYRHYATLYFVFLVDSLESELVGRRTAHLAR